MAIRQQFEDGYTEICVITVIVVAIFINIDALSDGGYFYTTGSSPSRNIGLVQVTPLGLALYITPLGLALIMYPLPDMMCR